MSEAYISKASALSFGYCYFCCMWDRKKKTCKGLPAYQGLSADMCVQDLSSRSAIITSVTGRRTGGNI